MDVGRSIPNRIPRRKWIYGCYRWKASASRFVFLRTEFDERDREFSPDGKWIAYSSDES